MKKLIIVTLLAGALAGCASSVTPIDTTNEQALSNLTQEELNAQKPTGSKIRLTAIKDTAMTLGAQGGLAWRAEQINQMLDKTRDNLSQIFNFNGLMLGNNVLPPVLEESTQSLNLSSSTALRIADRTYKIVQQARFVTTPPTWQQYIWMQYSKPDVPDSTLLPRDSEERNLWKKNIALGWQEGIQQANHIYAANLARLQRDYQGMILYRKLLAQHMVSEPTVVKYSMGVTTDQQDGALRVNDQALQITATPQFQTDTKAWTPALIQKNQ